MQQLTLHLLAEQPATLDNFVVGTNVELGQWIASLKDYTHQKRVQQHERAEHAWDRRACPIYLWGAAGSGKSHLAQAFEQALGQPSFDDVQALETHGQDALFAAINRARSELVPLIATGNAPPRLLPLRSDVCSRLAWGLVLELKALNDQDKALALQRQAQDRGWMFEAGVIDYILNHTERDMRALSALIRRLDTLSLSLHRRITVPLVRQALGLGGQHTASPVE
jgi:DnaA family protein